jgi:putative membrane protein
MTARKGSALETALFILLGFLVVAYTLTQVLNLLAGDDISQRISWTVLVVILTLLSLVHGAMTIGLRRIMLFLAIAVVLSLAFELVGVQTGWPYGAYEYTEVLSSKLFGLVPWVIPLAYFAVLYPSWLTASTFLRVTVTATERLRLPVVVGTAITGALAMTAWDLTMDPVMSGPLEAWIWQDGGPWFGVPLSNYFGWVLVNGTILVLYLIATRFVPHRPLASQAKALRAVAIVLYGSLWLGDILLGYPAETRLVAAFAQGIPMSLALLALFESGTEGIPGEAHPRRQG